MSKKYQFRWRIRHLISGDVSSLPNHSGRLGRPGGQGGDNRTAGSMRQRGENSWNLRVYVGRDPVTGRKISIERTVRGSKREASKVLAAMVRRGPTTCNRRGEELSCRGGRRHAGPEGLVIEIRAQHLMSIRTLFPRLTKTLRTRSAGSLTRPIHLTPSPRPQCRQKRCRDILTLHKRGEAVWVRASSTTSV